MDILGIGFPELLFIFVVALMIFGPRRLPEMAAKAGKLVRDLRNVSQGFMTEWQREIAVVEELEQVRKELEATKQSLQQVKHEVTAGTAEIDQTLRTVTTVPRNTPPIPSPVESNEISPEKDVPSLPTPAASPLSSVEATE